MGLNPQTAGGFETQSPPAPPSPSPSPPPPPPPPANCSEPSEWLQDTAGNGVQVYYGSSAGPTACCAEADAFNARSPPVAAVIWTWSPVKGGMCYLHSTLSTYNRSGATSGLMGINGSAADAAAASAARGGAGAPPALLVSRTLLLVDAGTLFAGSWPPPASAPPYAFSCNGYFSPGGAVPLDFPGNLSGAAWMAAGQDPGSLIGVDPDVSPPGYIVPSGSPMVTRCGFVPIDYTRIGRGTA